ncbi:MAG: hypothetical protein VR67_18825 [Peptococcaceae bacterium BRH_c8a]|nr:MAG: hypothetical protein VR67_18825 [Peptococcaceae bacterium BRH_c8a]
MSWAALLLSVTGYSWYLVFAYMTYATYPGLWTGLAGLFCLALLPTVLGFTINRSLLASGPTVLKLVLINLLLYLLYTGLTALGSVMIADYLFWNPPHSLTRAAYLFPSAWQLLAWLIGTYYVFQTADIKAAAQPTGIKTVETSLVLVIPAIFLLTYMGFAGPLLIILVAGWFLALALTLAIEGTGVTATSVIRYDIVLFHALVPPLAAIILCAAAFLGEIRSVLQAARGALFALLAYLVKLLDMLFPPLPESNVVLPEMASPPMPTGGAENVQEPASWFIYIIIGLGLLLLIPILRGLLGLLRIRLGAVPRLPQKRYSPFRALLQVWRWLITLVCSLLKIFAPLVTRLKALAGGLRQKIKTILNRWLPAKTPGQKIFRSYEAFLRLGRRAGCPRQIYETPLEYARRLQTATTKQPYPGAEISRLTGLFLEASYSKKPLSWQQAAESERLFKTIAHSSRGRFLT